MLEPITRSAGCPGTRGQCVNARSLTSVLEATGSDPPGQGPSARLLDGLLSQGSTGITGSPRHHPATRQFRQAQHHNTPTPQPATAPHPGFSPDCDHPPGDEAFGEALGRAAG